MDQIYCSGGPIILAAGMDGLRVAEATLVLGVGSGVEEVDARAPPTELLAQVVVRIGPDEVLRQIVGLDEEEPMVVGRREVLVRRLKYVVCRYDIQDSELRNSLRMVQSHPVRDAAAPIVTYDGERIEP